MKLAFLIVVLLMSLVALSAQGADAAEKMAMLKLTDAYSQCSAYYQIAASVAGAGQEEAKRKAEEMQAQAEALAMSTAEELVSTDVADSGKVKLGATRLTKANYAAAMKDLLRLAKSDQEGFRHKIMAYKAVCRSAIEDPVGYTERVLERTSKTQ
jgi:hypothetical protein